MLLSKSESAFSIRLMVTPEGCFNIATGSGPIGPTRNSNPRVCLSLLFVPAGGYFYAQQGGSHAV